MRSSTASRAVRNSTGIAGVVLAHAAEHLHPVHVGQHHVERDRVGLELPSGADGGHAGGGGADLPALVAKGHAQQLGDVGLVVDHEDPRRRAVRALELLGLDRVPVHGGNLPGAR